MGLFSNFFQSAQNTFANLTNSVVEMRKYKIDAKYDSKNQENELNALLSMGGYNSIGRDSRQKNFGDNMQKGITSTFENFANMFGARRGGNLGVPGGNGKYWIIGLGAIALLGIFLFTRKKRRK